MTEGMVILLKVSKGALYLTKDRKPVRKGERMAHLKPVDDIDIEKELIAKGFEIHKNNTQYLIRYIPDQLDWFEKGGGMDIDTPYYRTLYFDRENKELYAYHEYMDQEIEMKDEWIEDIRSLFSKVQDQSMPLFEDTVKLSLLFRQEDLNNIVDDINAFLVNKSTISQYMIKDVTPADRKMLQMLKAIHNHCADHYCDSGTCRFYSKSMKDCQIRKFAVQLTRKPEEWDMQIIERIIK